MPLLRCIRIYLNSVLSLNCSFFVFGNSCIVLIYLSRAAFLSGFGVKLLLFLTSEISSSSVPSKYSISLSFLLNSLTSSVSFSAFPLVGVVWLIRYENYMNRFIYKFYKNM